MLDPFHISAYISIVSLLESIASFCLLSTISKSGNPGRGPNKAEVQSLALPFPFKQMTMKQFTDALLFWPRTIPVCES